MYNNVLSNKWSIKRGVRQGGVLSAFLFCIHVDDILKSLAELCVGCKLGINDMNIQAYADDMVLLSPSPCGLRKLLSLAANLIEADLILNVRKTVVMVFRSKLAVSDDNLRFYLNNELLNVVTTVNYLRCILSKNLNDFFRYREMLYSF